MKRMALVLALVVIPMLAQASDYEVTMDQKKDAPSEPNSGPRVKTSRKWSGTVKINCHTPKTSSELEVRYIIFVKWEHIGQKGPDTIEQVKGNSKVTALKLGSSTTVPTSEITLNQGHMGPGWRPREGGATFTQDGVVGVWIKLFDGTTQVAEYVDPTNLPEKNKWE